MQSRLKKYLIYLLPFVLGNILFAKMPDKIEKVFNKMEADTVFKYAYHKKTIGPEDTILESYNPELPIDNRWNLISVNGKEPEQERIEQYQKRKEQIAEVNGNSRQLRFTNEDMKDFQLINDSNGILTYIFQFAPDENDKVAEHLQGEIKIDKKIDVIKRIKMYNKAPFSPAFSVKIDTFSMVIEYQQMKATGACKISQVQTKVKGKAFVFKKIETDVEEEYFNYVLVE
ncbi:MAG: hypothetical protein K9M80_08610 [Candidatus Marinimicrobia bacterium]|nr:hypothetical protein [Candidatus Neomarinimicrobiota bacterium]